MNNTEIKKKLFHPKTNKYNFLAQLKADSDYDSFKHKIKGIIQHPFGKQALLSNPLPKSLPDLRTNNIIPHSGNLEAEIAWIMHSVLENADLINQFIELKNAYEKSFLLNNYEYAEAILDQIENSISYSNWGLESRLLLAEEKSGTERNWLLLNEYSQKIKDPLTLFLLEQSSKKAENKMSYIRYKDNFENVINDTGAFLHEYLCFKVLYPGYTGFKNYSFIINVESISSIIDRYLLLIDILIELIPKGKDEFILKVTTELIDKISNDQRLKQLFNLFSNDFILLKDREGIVEYIDRYSIGDYNFCIDNAPSILRQYPTTIEPYLIYIKSLIESKQNFISLNVAKNIDEISSKLYNAFAVNENFNNTIGYLLKTSLKYFSFNFGKQLFGVISQLAKLEDSNNIHQFYYLINSEFNNPKILNYISILNNNVSNKVFNDYKEKVNTISSKINFFINKGNYTDLEKCPDISIKRRGLYIAKALYKGAQYSILVEHLERVILEDNSIITKKEVVELLYDGYIVEGKHHEALVLFVNTFLKNKYLVNRLNGNKLLKMLLKMDESINTIDLPIFYNITNPDLYEQYVKYDEFLQAKGLQRPTQLIKAMDGIPTQKLVYFLKEICSIEIMHHSLYFDGTDDIENERINILKHLLVIDTDFETDYIKEITEITQRTKIRKAIREVNKGRISVNTQQLKSKEESNIKDNFERYKELVVFSSAHNLKSLDPTSKMLNQYFGTLHDKSLRDKVVNINDPAFISFKSMFIDLRDKFILSKDFGLDGYLSTRIRHGTFLNHIRSNFEKLNLVSQKNQTEYTDNEYWNIKSPPTLESKKDSLQKSIKTFSKNIDEYTEYIIKELIQVKTEKYNQKPNAFFDFTLGDTTLAYLFKESKDTITTYTSFLNFVFENLEALTDVRLKEIRSYFQKEIKNKYSEIIDGFDCEIRSILGNTHFIDLTNSIVKCKTNIQNELDSISEWFNISNPSSDNLLDFETIIKTAVEITNTIYPQKHISPKISVNTDMQILGGVHIIYVIRILLDNIIKHSQIQGSKFETNIEVELIEQRSLKLIVSNRIVKHQEEEIFENLSKVKEKWSNNEDFTKSNIEGGSGFDKIRRILMVDMKMTNCSFDFKIKDNWVEIHIQMDIIILSAN